MLWLCCIPVIIVLTFQNLNGDEVLWEAAPNRSFLEWCFMLFLTGFISGLISLVPVGIAVFLGSLPQVKGIPDQDYELVSLREKDGFTGQSYFLGIGHIGDAQYYFWYRKELLGNVTGGKTFRSPCVDIFATTERPIMRTFKTAYVNPFIMSWYWLIGIDLRSPSWCPQFFLPPGTIQEGFSL